MSKEIGKGKLSEIEIKELVEDPCFTKCCQICPQRLPKYFVNKYENAFKLFAEYNKRWAHNFEQTEDFIVEERNPNMTMSLISH